MSFNLALVQMAMSHDSKENLATATKWIREAKKKGADAVMLPELFATPYFCQIATEDAFPLAAAKESHPVLQAMKEVAKHEGLILIVSYFEQASQAYFNSVQGINSEGGSLGHYRKAHIPTGPGYEEKFYFSPGDTPPSAWQTPFGSLGVGICWDQWFPELARLMVLKGADLLLYPTAIGSEPLEVGTPTDSKMWQRVMVGHAVANSCYVAAANRVGEEKQGDRQCQFYGHSFIADYRGEILVAADEEFEGVLVQKLDLEAAQRFRAGMGLFRDRRVDLYRDLLSLDGSSYTARNRETLK